MIKNQNDGDIELERKMLGIKIEYINENTTVPLKIKKSL